MRIAARLRGYGYWGLATPPAFQYSLTSDKAIKSAQKRAGALNGIRVIRADDESTRALMLEPRLVSQDADNAVGAWARPLGGTNYLQAFPTATGAGAALKHADTAGPSLYLSTTYKVLRDTPWTLRALLFEPPEVDGDDAVWSASWERWAFMVIKERAVIALRRAGWTQNQEDALLLLESQESLTSDQQATANALRATLYEVWQSVSLEPGGDGWYGTAWAITFIPEPRGALTLVMGEGTNWQEQTVEVPRIIQSRKPARLWFESALTIRANRGAYFWQAGYPVFPPYGVLRNGAFQNGFYVDSLGSLITSTISHRGANVAALPGTAVSLEREELNAITSEIVLTLTTTNPRLTPFVYAAAAVVEGGARGGSTDLVFDSNSTDDPGTSPIKNIEPNLTGEMRRSQYRVTMRDIDGATFGDLGSRYEALENRTCNLTIGGIPVITGGIITDAQLGNMAQATTNQNRHEVANSDTEIILTVCDQWAILEETLLGEGDLIGDGIYLGSFIRRALRFAGIKTAEMTGVAANAGRLLPKGVPGEGFAIMSSEGTSVANMLRDVVGKWGIGNVLYQSGATGVWTFARRSSSVAQVGGQNAVFVSGSGHSATTYPGRFAILKPLDHIRDTSDYYNYFRVEGAEDGNGQPIVADRLTHESLKGGGNTQNRHFIGRLKPFGAQRDDGIRSLDDAKFAVRSLYELNGKPPRFLAFQTYFHIGLFPGDLITVDGILCEIVRISGDIQSDRSTITAREIRDA